MISPKLLVSSYLDQQGHTSLIPFLEYPTDPSMGDVALPCFQLAKELKKSPAQIASDLALSLPTDMYVSSLQAVGPYVNFFINRTQQSSVLFDSIAGGSFGSGNNRDTTILVESPGPNTNKPLHLGHVRNMLLGNSLAKILEFAGYRVKKVDIINDRGVHICKSMLAYKSNPTLLFQGESTKGLNKKSDHFVGDCYIAYDKGLKEHPEREQEIQEMLLKREQNDPEIRTLRQQMNKRCLEGHATTYQRYGTHIDKGYLESDHYLKGKELVEQGVKDGVFLQNEKGNIVADLTAEMGQEKTVLRADGTSIYITQDLALGKIRYEDFCMDRMIYVVGNEQEDHFKALFHLFKKLGYSFADTCYHLSYGMIELPDGKMKSREGNVVDADWLADEMHTRVIELLQERYPALLGDELQQRAEIIAMAAIKFFILKYDAKKGFVFDREHSLDFAGETGPYVLYSYARCKSILEKGCQLSDDSCQYFGQPITDNRELTNDERILLSMLAKFPETIEQSAKDYAPALITRYLLTLSAQRNSYYHHTKILDDELSNDVREFRLQLVMGIAEILKQGLNLLGIGVLEKM